tara:strand:- start:915 stop:1925 length:1011 start_codon:yes stop_codon:yes gene_type:complete
MDRKAFHYHLPRELIAQTPLDERSASRLLALKGSSLEGYQFSDLAQLLRPGDLLILNDTRVIPARLYGQKPAGGKVEILLERVTGTRTAIVQLGASKNLSAGTALGLAGGVSAHILEKKSIFFELVFDTDLEPFLMTHGEVPLPPYIKRVAGTQDKARYQTIYARTSGAVAAPTAGLHLDPILLDALDKRSIKQAFITLHIGAGTFAPVRTEKVEDHRLHSEWFKVSEDLCDRIKKTKASGGRIIAVGTTTVRALESAALNGLLHPCEGETTLFIYPGFQFRVIDAMVTNFHLPESSLLMLVAAFAGRRTVLGAYRHAVAHRYRFFSYGDAMLVQP